jgi:hypothetical protein
VWWKLGGQPQRRDRNEHNQTMTHRRQPLWSLIEPAGPAFELGVEFGA